MGNSGQQKWAISGAIVTPQGVDTSVPDPFGWKFELLLDGKQNTHRDYIFDVRMMIVMTQQWLSPTNSNLSLEIVPTFAFLLRPLSVYKHLEFAKLLDLIRKYVIITNIALVLSGGNIFPGS